MKLHIVTCLPACFIALAVSISTCRPSLPVATLYPAPDVSELSKVRGLAESSVFGLSVNGENAFVYHGYEIHDPFEWYGDAGTMVNSPSYAGVHYCSFEMTRAVRCQIAVDVEIDTWKIMPPVEHASLDAGGRISFVLDAPRKVILMINEESEPHYFIVSAEPPQRDVPDSQDPSVLYLGPGVHRFGQAWDPFVDGIRTVYLAGGAVVEATIKARNKNRIRILGRGLFAQSFVTHAEEVEHRQEQEWDADWMGIHIGNSRNIELNGFALLNSPGYQLELANCDSVLVRLVKLCGFGEHNNDGLHTYGRDILVEDCLVVGNDDRICITGLFDPDDGRPGIGWDGTNALVGTHVDNITIRGVVFWGLHNNGGDIMLTWNGSDYCRNVTVEECVSLTPTNLGFLAARHGGSAIISDFTFKNIHLYHPNLFWLSVEDSGYMGEGGGAIRDFVFENITIDAEPSEIGTRLAGQDENSHIAGFRLHGVKANGKLIVDLKQTAIQTNSFVREIHFHR